jgi:endonuclease VIII-like 1
MPELAEVKIMSDFINAVATNQFFDTVEKSEVSKVKTDLNAFGGAVFTLKAQSRGKEMLLELNLVGGGPNGDEVKTMNVILGMSGSWAFVRHDSPEKERVLKHSHLRFITIRGDLLVLHDVRRFAKWKWGTWGADRGPCPLTEYNEFANRLRTYWPESKGFQVPLNEMLMNQHYFNGVGNYLRAEILNRMSFSPFTVAASLNRDQLEALIKMVHLCVRDAYSLGGGQIKDWVNPHGTGAVSFKDWMTVYGKGSSIVDKTGRRFWYDPEWESEVPQQYRKNDTNEKDVDI